MLRMQNARIDSLHLRALGALAAAATAPAPAEFLRAAAGDARRLESEGAPRADAHAYAIRAALAAGRGDRVAAAELVSQAAALFDAADMGRWRSRRPRPGDVLPPSAGVGARGRPSGTPPIRTRAGEASRPLGARARVAGQRPRAHASNCFQVGMVSKK
jgi:hypothetical protein